MPIHIFRNAVSRFVYNKKFYINIVISSCSGWAFSIAAYFIMNLTISNYNLNIYMKINYFSITSLWLFYAFLSCLILTVFRSPKGA